MLASHAVSDKDHTHLYSAQSGLVTPLESGVMHFRDYQSYQTDKGTTVVKGIRVFRTGTFTDMFGTEMSWDANEIASIAANYNALKVSQALPNVPMRIDHLTGMDSVVGYFDNVYVDPEDPNFLAVDLEFTRASAYADWESGTLRNRSAEIGPYKTNDGVSYFPVLLGCAFVDIPAVEGLHSNPKNDKMSFFSIMQDKENDMDPKNPGWAAAAQYAQWVENANFAKACEDWSQAAIYAQWAESAAFAQVCADWEVGATYSQAVLDAATAGTVTFHGQAPANTFAFQLHGQSVVDPVTVQAHIHGMEATLAAVQDTNRKDFVTKLASDNKIGAPQIDSLTELALGMTVEQFTAFTASYKDAPKIGMFGTKHADGSPDPALPNDQTGESVETLEAIVSNLTLFGGMSEEQVKNTGAYKRLAAAKAAG